MTGKISKDLLSKNVKIDANLYDVILRALDAGGPEGVLTLLGHACAVNSLFDLEDGTCTSSDMGAMIRYVLDNWDELLPKAHDHFAKIVEEKAKQ